VLGAVRDGLPELPTVVLPRHKVVALAAASAATGFVHLHGSTGMGKSTVALLVARQMLQAPLWLDLRAAGDHAPALVRAAATHLLKMHDVHSLVLEDVTFDGDSRPLQDAIAAAASAIIPLGGVMLVTSTTGLPRRLQLRLKFPVADCQHEIPGLDEAEVCDLLAIHGFQDETARRHWARLGPVIN
jgi:hypothetical protein